MSDRDEWGEWQSHDGTGCPCLGMYVQAEFEVWRTGNLYTAGHRGLTEGLITPTLASHPAWFWASKLGQRGRHPKSGREGRLDGGFVRYRIRKPRALIQLREMIETLPAPSRKEDAHV